MSDNSRYDVLVVGAGPGGAMAARHAAEGGLRVALLERSETVGTPVRCGEAAGRDALAECTEVDESWIGATVHGVTMISPSGIPVDIARMAEGLILKRDVMDRCLAERAAAAGAAFLPGVTVVSVTADAAGYECVDQNGQRYASRCLVLADGVESRVARLLGWKTALRLDDVCSCAFARVVHEKLPVDRIEMHYGTRVAPAGYGWVFPRGDGSANVGLGILGTRSAPGLARAQLEKFVKARFGDAAMTHLHCGGVPVGRWTRPLVRGAALLVGDAGRQVDALSGGGITYAMSAGKLAAQTICNAFSSGTLDASKLCAYERTWARGPGRQLMRTYALKQMVIGLGDSELDSIARRLVARKGGALSLFSICFVAFAKRPLLLLKALMVYR